MGWLDIVVAFREAGARLRGLRRKPARFGDPAFRSAVVIPCLGRDYAREAALAAGFARSTLPDAVEVRIVTDVGRELFGDLASGVVHDRVAPEPVERTHYAQMWQSRILKIRAPLRTAADLVLMIDSDLMLIRPPVLEIHADALCGVIRPGRAFNRWREFRTHLRPLSWWGRNGRKRHMNGGFLAAHRSTWERLAPAWETAYRTIWQSEDREDVPPTDQIALNVALDRTGIFEQPADPAHNWPVAKRWNKDMRHFPPDVVGAHGGFPLEEWDRYRVDPSCSLSFRGQDFTRAARYLDRDKAAQAPDAGVI